MKRLWALLLTNALCTASLFAFIPVIGPIIREIGLEEWHSGLVVAVAGVVWMICAPLWGRLSDKKGRKGILLAGSIGFALSYLCLAQFLGFALHATLSVWSVVVTMVLLRGIMGGFYAAVPTVSAARIADATNNEQRTKAMAILGAVNGVGMVAGPALSAMVIKNSLIMALYAAAALPFISLILLWGYLPKGDFRSSTKPSKLMLFDARIRLSVITAFIVMNAIITAQMLVGFYAMDRLLLDSNAAAKAAGMVMATVGITLIVTQITMSKISNVSAQTWIRGGMLVGAVGVASVAMVHSTAMLMLCYSIAAIGLGVCIPAMQSFAANAVEQDEQGAAAGSVSSAQGLAMVVSPMLSTIIYKFGATLPFIMAAGLMILLSLTIHKITRSTS